MKKKHLISIIIISLFVLFYSTVIGNEKDKIANSDRSVLVMDYKDKNYYGSFNTDAQAMKFMELPEDLNITKDKQVKDYKSMKKFDKDLQKTLEVSIDDTFKLSGDKIKDSNLTDETKEYYKNFQTRYDEVKKVLSGELKYHPRYNKQLVEVAKVNAEKKGTSYNGEMSNREFKKLVEQGISNKIINESFIKVINQDVTCKDDVCLLEQPNAQTTVMEMNKGTNNKINISNISEKEEEEK